MAKIEKPLLYGDATIDAKRLLEELPAAEDNSYVPGYSEKRRANEVRVKEGHEPLPLPRLQWIPIGTVSGDAAPTRDTMQFYRLGYRFMTKDVLEGMGFELPPAAHVAADGTIRREDLGLACVDWETYEINKAKLEAENRAQQQNVAVDNPELQVLESVTGRGSLQEAKQALSQAHSKE